MLAEEKINGVVSAWASETPASRKNFKKHVLFTVVIKGALRATKNTNVALKALQQFIKSCHLTAGTIQILVVAEFFSRFFLVTILFFVKGVHEF